MFGYNEKLAGVFEISNIEQVPLEDNFEVDTLANLGSAFRITPDVKISVVYIMEPVISQKEILGANQDPRQNQS